MTRRSASSEICTWSRFQAVGGQLPREQVAPRDLQLLLLGVARELDDFHAVAQRRRNGVEHVRGADEQHLRQIEGHAEIVVAERVVLLRIEHLEQRRERIALMARRELVHLVEHEHRIAAAGLAHGLHDVPRQRADVGAPMAADLRLIVHAAEAHPAELAVRAPWRCSGRARSCRRPADRRSTEWDCGPRD